MLEKRGHPVYVKSGQTPMLSHLFCGIVSSVAS